MKILITGISGFAGTTLANALLETESGLEIFGMDNFSRAGSEQNRRSLAASSIDFRHGDIRLASDFEALPKVDWVIDVAANPSVLAGVDGKISSRQLIEHNLIGTINILEYCKLHGAGLILLSTSRIYSIQALSKIPIVAKRDRFQLATTKSLPQGLSPAGIDETFSTAPPVSLYGSTKLASETLALEYGDALSFPVWINRCGVLAGAGQFGRADQGIFSFWINSWLRRRPIKYIGFGGKGHQVRDCLHPRDLVPLFQKQMAAGMTESPRVFNIGGGIDNAISLAELSNWCHDRLGPHEVATEPHNRKFDIPWMVMDSTLASETWKWLPRTSLEDILEEILLHAEKNPYWLDISGLS